MDFIVGDLVRAKWTFDAIGAPISVPWNEEPLFYKGKPVQRSSLIAIGTGMITSTAVERTCRWDEDKQVKEYEVTFMDGDREWLPQDCLTPIVPKTEEVR